MTRPMRIALVAQNIVRADGQGRVMLELARAAAAAGNHVDVVARRADPEVISLPGVRWRRIAPAPPGPQAVAGLTFARAAARALRDAAPDASCVKGSAALPPHPYVYYASFSAEGWRATWAETRPRLHHRVHTSLLAARERRSLARADAVMAVSSGVARDLIRVMPPGAAPPTVVPNGVDVAEFPEVTPEARASARRRFGLDPEDFVAAFVGEFNTPRKGLPALLRALALSTDPRERVLAAGDGNAGRLSRLNGGRAVFAGHVTPVAHVYAAADVVVVPSVYEPFSMVALEAAASGVPLILSNRAGVIAHLAGACIPLADPTDPACVRAALDLVKSRPGRAAELAAGARRSAEALAWPVTARRALEVIEGVIAARRTATVP